MKLSHPTEFLRLGGSTILAYAHPLRRFYDLEGFLPNLSGDQRKRRPSDPLLDFDSPSAFPNNSRQGNPGNSHGICASTALVSLGNPDTPRFATSPVSSTFRVSHPPGGLLFPRPTRPYFVPRALLRFTLRGFSPPTSRTSLEAVAPLSFRAKTEQPTEVNCATNVPDFEALLPLKIRAHKTSLTRPMEPIPPWASASLKLSPLQPGPF